MSESILDTQKLVDEIKENPKSVKALNKGTSWFALFTLIFRVVLFLSLMGILETRFEKIIICLLMQIIYSQKFDALLYDKEKFKDTVSDSAYTMNAIAIGVPIYLALGTLIYLVFIN
ncbi:MAG: hypothetical protein WCO12_02870 [bacterium]